MAGEAKKKTGDRLPGNSKKDGKNFSPAAKRASADESHRNQAAKDSFTRNSFESQSRPLREIFRRKPAGAREALEAPKTSADAERERKNSSSSSRTPAQTGAKEISDPKEVQIAQLKQELAIRKEYLQSIIESQEASNEALQSANEEIQSGNEKLQSANEELKTSKQELESASEELNTVNREIQRRNQQLAQLSDDLINVLNSATIPIIVLGHDLHIRHFTPEAERVFGFSGLDVGRALTLIPLNLDVPQFERWMLDVMRETSIRIEQVHARDGKIYRLRIAPYRTLENKIEGVVVTLVDISDRTPYMDGHGHH